MLQPKTDRTKCWTEAPVSPFGTLETVFAGARSTLPLPLEESPLTHFDDLTECDYFGAEHAHSLRAVGWLAVGKAFSTGRTDSETFAKLKVLLNDPWQPMVFGGIHHCELCQFDPPHSHANLFVPNNSIIFVCPELIVHYIAAHHYRPPDEFIAALADCPNTRTMQYKKMLLQSGGRTLVPKSG